MLFTVERLVKFHGNNLLQVRGEHCLGNKD